MSLHCQVCILTVFTLFCINVQDSSPRGAHAGTLKHSQNGSLCVGCTHTPVLFSMLQLNIDAHICMQRVLFCICSGVHTGLMLHEYTHVYSLCIYTDVHTHDPLLRVLAGMAHTTDFSPLVHEARTHTHAHTQRQTRGPLLPAHAHRHAYSWPLVYTQRRAHTWPLSPSAHGGARSAFQRWRSPAESRHTRTRAQAPPLSQGG